MEDLKSLTLYGTEGSARIRQMMNLLRENPPVVLGGLRVLAVRDYTVSMRKDFTNGLQNMIDLPKSNVLYFELENNGWCCVRPSGTEPKIKFYFGVKESSESQAKNTLENIKESILQIFK